MGDAPGVLKAVACLKRVLKAKPSQRAPVCERSLQMFVSAIERELEKYLPFLATTKLLMAAVKAGAGREQAHERIKHHAVGAALALRESSSGDNVFLAEVAADPELPLDSAAVAVAVADPASFVGRAEAQVVEFGAAVAAISARHPDAGSYQPAPIL